MFYTFPQSRDAPMNRKAMRAASAFYHLYILYISMFFFIAYSTPPVTQESDIAPAAVSGRAQLAGFPVESTHPRRFELHLVVFRFLSP